MSSIRVGAMLSLLAAAMLALPMTAGAQTPETSARYQQVISLNPFGILLELFNIEYERVVSESTTAGIGGSYWGLDEDEDYLNVDVFWRFYMQERPLEGWSFGAKAGLTNIPDEGTYPGFGFDLNRSWLMGRNNNFYIGAGFGLKRLFGNLEDQTLEYIPTIRVVNVGIAF